MIAITEKRPTAVSIAQQMRGAFDGGVQLIVRLTALYILQASRSKQASAARSIRPDRAVDNPEPLG
jgi:hypothetical protein